MLGPTTQHFYHYTHSNGDSARKACLHLTAPHSALHSPGRSPRGWEPYPGTICLSFNFHWPQMPVCVAAYSHSPTLDLLLMLCIGVLPTALMHQSVFDSTRTKYANTLRMFLEFCNGETPDAARMESFMVHRYAIEDDKGKSLQQYASHLTYFHQLGMLPPVHTSRIQRLIQGACRSDAEDVVSTKLNLHPVVVLRIRKRAAQPSAPPDHVAVACQCALGLRGREIESAESWHVTSEATFIVPPSKHDRTWRTLPIPPEDAPLFEKLRQCLPFKRGTYARTFRRVCRAYNSEATPHDARRFFATSQQCLTTQQTTITHYLRHASTKPTEVYIRSMPEAWRKIIRRHFHPVPTVGDTA